MLIGLHGRKQAGKDTVFYRLSLQQRLKVPVERRAFADKLYESAAALLNVTVRELDEWKADPGVLVAFGSRWEDGTFFPVQTLTVREYLQRYGTEAHRDVFGENFWTEQVDLEHDGKIVVVTDVRFPNEAERVRKAGGIVVHVVGPREVENAGDGHASETPLPADLIDAQLGNTRRDDGYAQLDHGVRTLVDLARVLA